MGLTVILISNRGDREIVYAPNVYDVYVPFLPPTFAIWRKYSSKFPGSSGNFPESPREDPPNSHNLLEFPEILSSINQKSMNSVPYIKDMLLSHARVNKDVDFQPALKLVEASRLLHLEPAHAPKGPSSVRKSQEDCSLSLSLSCPPSRLPSSSTSTRTKVFMLLGFRTQHINI